MTNPIFDSDLYRRDLPEARALEVRLRVRFCDVGEAGTIVGGAKLDVTEIDMTGAPSTFWAAILNRAAKLREVKGLLESVERNLRPAPKDAETRAAIEGVRQVDKAGGSRSSARLLLSGDRPFLGRTTLRNIVPELQNWNSAASILVVRGDPDSGRTETQILIADGSDPARERIALLHELLPLQSTVRQIWKVAEVPGDAPTLGQESLTTESATLWDFWIDVGAALDAKDLRLWVLFDDLDKGPGRVAVRTLAEVLAVQLKAVSFQRRIRLVLLGYPEERLPDKVTSLLVRNDTTEKLDDSHVQAFLDFCMKSAGKNFDAEWLKKSASDICAQAQAKTTAITPYLEALNGELRTWYRGL